MAKNTISCRKCNAKFKSILDFRIHICPNEETAPKWNRAIGRVGRRRKRTEGDVYKQPIDDWLLQAEEQRKNYRKKQR